MRGTPVPADFSVETPALRKQANYWEDEGVALGRIASDAQGLRINHLQAGLFAGCVGPYEAAVDMVVNLCAEGNKRMAEIGDALRKNADGYDRVDAEAEERLTGTY